MDTTASCAHCNVGDSFVWVEEEVAMRVNVGRRQDVRQAFDADKGCRQDQEDNAGFRFRCFGFGT